MYETYQKRSGTVFQILKIKIKILFFEYILYIYLNGQLFGLWTHGQFSLYYVRICHLIKLRGVNTV